MIDRRRFFSLTSGLGATAISLSSLLAEEEREFARNRTNSHPLHHAATARSVIFLFMSGGPSQVDTFDPKPDLKRLAGQDVPDSLAARIPRIKRAGLRNLLASPWKFSEQGDSGLAVSELFPQVGALADDLCVIRSLNHRNPVHGPGECVALTGSGNGDRPSLGAWSLYGLGSMNQSLPAFITMNLHNDGMQFPQAAGWGAGFLPARFQGTVVEPQQGIRHSKMPANTTLTQRKAELDLIESMNRQLADGIQGHDELLGRLETYRTAFELQTAGPALFDLSQESASTLADYGLTTKATEQVAHGCLLARRMVAAGVRFVQLRVGGWDAHSKIKSNHERLAQRTDRPIAALLRDLKLRGLLDSTLVVWGGEFGRTPTMEGRSQGRDHSPAGYTVWMAGGGVQGGQVIGETDEIGYTVVDRPVSPQDLHATILHALGLDARRLIFNHHGLEESPLGVTNGAPIREVFG